MADSLRPNFLPDVIQLSAIRAMDYLAVKILGLSNGVAYVSVQTDKGISGTTRHHIIDPLDRFRKMNISSEGFHPVDFFGDAFSAILEAMKQHATSEAVPDEVQTSFPGAVKTMDVGGFIVHVGFAGGTPDENEKIADFGMHILLEDIEKQ